MGVIIPQVLTEDRASGAQIVDGSLRFDSGKNHSLKRIPISSGSKTTWTWSGWVKRSDLPGAERYFWGAYYSSLSRYFLIGFNSSHQLYIFGGNYYTAGAATTNINATTNAVFRDTSTFYHIIVAYDTTQATPTNRIKVYVNGVLQQLTITNTPSQNSITFVNSSDTTHYVGAYDGSYQNFNGQMTNVYLIDGQQLDESYFGYTDPLTNTWRPKKAKITLGSVWSNYFTGIGIIDAGSVTDVFDGNIATEFEFNSTGGNGVFRPPNPISYSTSVEVYSARTTTMNVSLNGGSNVAYGNGWTTIASGSGTLTYLTFSNGNAGNQKLGAIRVDGNILTNTSGAIDAGTNGFYLPLDGNTPIGQDQSGRGNNWTPVNFGGSNTLEKATGALPILNTDGGGKVARVGVRTDSNASSLVLALPLVGNKDDVSNKINSGSTTKTITNNNVTFSSSYSNFYGGSASFNGSNAYLTTSSTSDFLSGAVYTIECYLYMTSVPAGAGMIFDCGSGGGDPELYIYNDGGTVKIYESLANNTNWTGGSLAAGKWYHIAQVVQGTSASDSAASNKIYVDGVLSVSNTINLSGRQASSIAAIGARTNGTILLNAYIQDLRVYKGLAKYTQNFIPASTDPDILPDTPSGVSGSSKLTKVTDGAVSFDGTDDKLSISNTGFTNVGSSDPFTIEAFVYFKSLTNYSTIFASSTGSSGAGGFKFEIYNSLLRFTGDVSSSGTYVDIYSGPTLSTDRWYHLAVTRDGSGNVRTFVDGQIAGTDSTNTGFSITWPYDATIGTKINDVEDFSGFISNLHFVNGTALYTSNFTPPTASITSVANTKLLCCQSSVSQNIAAISPNLGGVNDGTVWSNYIFKTGTSTLAAVNNPDTNKTRSEAFNGLTGSTNEFVSLDGDITFIPPSTITGISQVKVYASGSSSFPNKIYVNGILQATLTSDTNVTVSVSSLSSVRSERQNTSDSARFSGIEIDGVLLKDPVASASNASATNFNPFTANINAVRGQESGYCTLNPLFKSSNITLSDGNLKAFNSGAGAWANSTFAINSGKWYWEALDITDGIQLGISEPSQTGLPSNRSTFYGDPGTGANVLLGVALDLDNLTVDWYIDGILTSSVSINAGTYTPVYGSNNSNRSAVFNFGQKPFKFPPPSGFQPLALANTPRPTIVRPDQYVGVTTYTGSGGTKTVSGLNFKPDLIWQKGRTVTGGYSITGNNLHDTVRGTDGTYYKELTTNSTNQENTVNNSLYGGLSAITDDGFTVVAGSDGTYQTFNGNGNTYVAWCWKAGGNSNTYNIDDVGYATAAAAGLTAGTITPTGASVNTKSGFSIISYNGTSNGSDTLPHGLNKSPSLVIIKNLTTTTDWRVKHSSLSSGYNLALNSNVDQFSVSSSLNSGISDLSSSSTIGFILGTNSDWAYTNKTGNSYVAYCWAEIPGFSKFGSVTLSASADDSFIWTGFRPRWFLIKGTGSTSNWIILDSTRDPFNFVDNELFANLSNAENAATSTYSFDFLSNGIKCRNQGLTGAFIYAAFAEAPTFNLYGGQANAR